MGTVKYVCKCSYFHEEEAIGRIPKFKQCPKCKKTMRLKLDTVKKWKPRR